MAMPTVTVEHVEGALRRLPSSRLREVLLFIEFLEFLGAKGDDDSHAEDADLWQAVLAHQGYRAAHSDEIPEEYDSPDAFLRATADL